MRREIVFYWAGRFLDMLIYIVLGFALGYSVALFDVAEALNEAGLV